MLKVCVMLRRRAYDALNVLTAMDIIAKDKKDIQWKGFPPMVGDSGDRAGGGGTSGGKDKEKARLKARIEQKNKELRQKEGNLKELVNQFVGLKQLLGTPSRIRTPTQKNISASICPSLLVSVKSPLVRACSPCTFLRTTQSTCLPWCCALHYSLQPHRLI